MYNKGQQLNLPSCKSFITKAKYFTKLNLFTTKPKYFTKLKSLVTKSIVAMFLPVTSKLLTCEFITVVCIVTIFLSDDEIALSTRGDTFVFFVICWSLDK
jgi:hypothetical protein